MIGADGDPPRRCFLYAPQCGGPVRSSGSVWRRFTPSSRRPSDGCACAGTRMVGTLQSYNLDRSGSPRKAVRISSSPPSFACAKAAPRKANYYYLSTYNYLGEKAPQVGAASPRHEGPNAVERATPVLPGANWSVVSRGL